MQMTAEPASYSLFRHRPVLLLWLARVSTSIAYQMQVVAVGWQIYVMTSSPMQLGLVGLMQFIPQFALVLIAGHVVDQHDRKRVMLSAQSVEACAVAILAVVTAFGLASSGLILAAVFALGAARSFEATTLQTIAPSIVPPAALPRVIAQLSSATQAATIAGPAVGGVMLILGTSYVYAMCALLFLGSTILVWCIPMERAAPKRTPLSFDTLFAGVNFVRRNPIVLGAMSLDMFAVIFAGATALLPIFARDIFQVGSWGLGLMRAAPAVGALTCSFIIARWPLTRHVGIVMYAAVTVFGLATILFGLSNSFILSMAMLVVIGASDMLSVVIRQPVIQLETPDAMRGRVSAVNSLFIGTSNQIGEFRAGVTADLFGTIPSVLIGGIGTLLIVLIWIKAFPALFRMSSFEQRYR
jgi:MFS family permease